MPEKLFCRRIELPFHELSLNVTLDPDAPWHQPRQQSLGSREADPKIESKSMGQSKTMDVGPT